MEGIKEAFTRVREDVDSLKKDINFLGGNLTETRDQLIGVCEILSGLNNKANRLDSQNRILNDYIDELKADLMHFKDEIGNYIGSPVESTKPLSVDSDSNGASLDFDCGLYSENTLLDTRLDNQTDSPTESKVLPSLLAEIETHQTYIRPGNANIWAISIGNQGVKTDRQTNQQTDVRRVNSSHNQKESIYPIVDTPQNKVVNVIDSAANMLDSLDSIKKELRLKFKSLTDQELIVFSTIYQLEDEFGYADYRSISRKLNLSESSIRDYVRRLVNKGIPINKTKVNNKEIHLSVSSNLKKVATLSAILELRNL
jgi:hypothetical protein